MRYLIIFCFVAGGIFLAIPSYEDVYLKPLEAPQKPKIAPRTHLRVKTVKHAPPTEKILKYATLYNVSPETMTRVIACESNYNPRAVGDGGNSFGLAQIHLPSHPYVTKEQAYDPDFAIDFLAKNLAKGNGRIWTCYRQLAKI